MSYTPGSGGHLTRDAHAPGPTPPSSFTSPALLGQVLVRLAENGYAAEIARCVTTCRAARSNAQLWERIVDLPCREAGEEDEGYRATALVHWAKRGDLARVRATLRRGADVNARDAYGNTALHWASARGHVAIARELLDLGTDIEARDAIGSTALMGACVMGRTAVVRELAARGADVNARSNSGAAPLSWACDGGHAATAAALLALGADVNARDGIGWTALIDAALKGHAACVRVLLAAPGIAADAADADGNTALSLARDEGRHAVVAALEWRRGHYLGAAAASLR